MKKKTFYLFLSIGIFSCASLADISISSHITFEDANLAKIEEAVVPLEAAGGTETRKRQSELLSARQLIVDIEKAAFTDIAFSAKISAWSGRLSILEGRYSEAQRLYRQSNAASPGNLPSVILFINLEGDPAKRLEIIEKELRLSGQRGLGAGEFNIEKGRALFELQRFSEAAGAFDIAFSSGINPVYIDQYRSVRNRAWEMRNSGDINARTLGMLRQESITWLNCINIIKNETQLFRFITGGRNFTDDQLFNLLLERGFIPYIQDVNILDWPNSKPRASETVTRAGAAFLIWHLFAELRADRGLLTQYSARFAAGANPRSPIIDIIPLSPFFDSILGCVEREIMSLPDGRNFKPAEFIRGAELLAFLRKIDN